MTLLFLFLFVGSLDQDLMDGLKQSLGEKAGTTKEARWLAFAPGAQIGMRKSAVSHLEAMEARSVGEIPRGDEWQYEPKWDGFRCLLSRNNSRTSYSMVNLWYRLDGLSRLTTFSSEFIQRKVG